MNDSTYETSTVQIDFDGAEGIALWFMNTETEEHSKLLFEDMPGFVEYLKTWFPGLFEETHTPTDDEQTPEFEALEQELFKHQPVLSMTDGSIAGCQCMDRVFRKRTEDWGTHLAEIFESLGSRRTVQGEPSDAQWEYRCMIEGWKGSPENTFREPTMWTTRQSAESTYEWQHARIGEEVAHDFQPHITAVSMSRRIKAGEPERVKGESSEDAALRAAAAVQGGER